MEVFTGLTDPGQPSQPCKAISPCPRTATAGPVSTSSEPCLAQLCIHWVRLICKSVSQPLSPSPGKCPMSKAGTGPDALICPCHLPWRSPVALSAWPQGDTGPHDTVSSNPGEDIGIYRSCLQSWCFHFHDWIKGLFKSVHITLWNLFLHLAVSTTGLWIKH